MRDLKAEAIRLRTEESMSYSEIHAAIGVPKGTLSGWLKGMPLPPDIARKKMAVNSYQQPKAPRGVESDLHREVPANGKSRHWKAKVAEAAVLLRLVIYGFHPFGSVFDGDKTDWLVEVPGVETKKVQVKWTSEQAHGRPVARLKCRDGHSGNRLYHDGEFDVVVAYDYFTDTAYVWTWAEVKGLGMKTISDDAAEAWHKMRF